MTTFPAGTFTPAPAAGPKLRMLAAHARTEVALTLRNGEQILLTLLIPIALLVGLTYVHVVSMPEPRVNSLVPRVFALAVMSSAFTGQAIALGFDRRYGVLKRLAATALPAGCSWPAGWSPASPWCWCNSWCWVWWPRSSAGRRRCPVSCGRCCSRCSARWRSARSGCCWVAR
ncbi:hypothetical protein GCM10029964_033860 [Kibdelosporangium lantanae]